MLLNQVEVFSWVQQKCISPEAAVILLILDCLLPLKRAGLSVLFYGSSWKQSVHATQLHVVTQFSLTH